MTVATLALVVGISAWIPSAAQPAGLSQSRGPFVCSVTHSDIGPYGNSALETMLPPNGRLLVGPGGMGEVLDDGRLSELRDVRLRFRRSRTDDRADHPEKRAARLVTDARARSRYGQRLVHIRILGGSVPAGPFIDAFQVPALGLSLANYDDNQHTDNENLWLGNLWNRIGILATIMTAP